MRALIVSIVIGIIIIFGWIYIFGFVESTTLDFVDKLNALNENISNGDWQQASTEFKKIEKEWNGTRDKWSVLLDHHEIDNIDLAMSKANQYIKSENISLSLGEVETLIRLFNVVRESQDLTFTNIL